MVRSNVLEKHSVADTNPEEPKNTELQQPHPNVIGAGSSVSRRLSDTGMREDNDELDDHHLVISKLVS